ncbi:hypothetical protein AURDEDRAFT_116730 [Auricularia subglabra TFB-10046 SS5]|uniref:Uncharacterized protein n=1 Tax=Auricularia subglabra (strain TFB-10046 / SS5) TaxID=717982 RepID=J0WW33_AURST|nr:hypothetical protein AURDEDRAFT_116730 [Auricularia subglabra TFB-10046 SS5]
MPPPLAGGRPCQWILCAARPAALSVPASLNQVSGDRGSAFQALHPRRRSVVCGT